MFTLSHDRCPHQLMTSPWLHQQPSASQSQHRSFDRQWLKLSITRWASSSLLPFQNCQHWEKRRLLKIILNRKEVSMWCYVVSISIFCGTCKCNFPRPYSSSTQWSFWEMLNLILLAFHGMTANLIWWTTDGVVSSNHHHNNRQSWQARRKAMSAFTISISSYLQWK